MSADFKQACERDGGTECTQRAERAEDLKQSGGELMKALYAQSAYLERHLFTARAEKPSIEFMAVSTKTKVKGEALFGGGMPTPKVRLSEQAKKTMKMPVRSSKQMYAHPSFNAKSLLSEKENCASEERPLSAQKTTSEVYDSWLGASDTLPKHSQFTFAGGVTGGKATTVRHGSFMKRAGGKTAKFDICERLNVFGGLTRRF